MSQTATDPLLKWRSEFEISESCNYLISNSLGAMPKRTRSRLGDYMDEWNVRGVRAWGDNWWDLQFEVADDIAAILGADPNTVSMHQNVAMASQAIMSCFSFDGPRNKIVYSDLNFPSVMYLYEAQKERGAEVVRVPSDDGIRIDLQRVLSAIDEKTLLVPMSHVLFRSSYIQDAKAIADRAREVGAFLILDVFQSVGAVPLKLKEWGVHAAVGGALKYVCGGPGNCFLYVAPEFHDKLTPTFTGWCAHKEAFLFKTDGHNYRDGGGRFLNGTPNVPALYAGQEGIKIIKEIGVEAIREKSMRITGKMVARCQELGFEILSPLDVKERGNHLSVNMRDAWEVCQVLNSEDIVCDYRPGAGIRFSPHFYNTEVEALSALDRVAMILENNEQERFRGAFHRPG